MSLPSLLAEAVAQFRAIEESDNGWQEYAVLHAERDFLPQFLDALPNLSPEHAAIGYFVIGQYLSHKKRQDEVLPAVLCRVHGDATNQSWEEDRLSVYALQGEGLSLQEAAYISGAVHCVGASNIYHAFINMPEDMKPDPVFFR